MRVKRESEKLSGPPRLRGEPRGFTILELLVATAVLMLMSAVLIGIFSQAQNIWSQGERQKQQRLRARAALETMGREMQRAMLPLDPAETNGLQFVINPSGVAQNHPHSVFFQTPVESGADNSDVTEIGYFVRWRDGRANLCRFLAHSGQTNLYLIRENPSAWISDTLLDLAAPGDKAGDYQGLFLENIVGLWVNSLDESGAPLGAGYDSRLHGNRLPAAVEISLALLDEKTAARVGLSPGMQSSLQTAVSSATDAVAFLGSLDATVRPGAGAVTFRINLSNQR